MPAYGMLSARNYAPGDGIESRSTGSRLDALANQAADRMAEKIALRGEGAAASGIAGGGVGVFISAGFTAWSIIEHEKERPSLEAELRKSLRLALNETSRLLNRGSGVWGSGIGLPHEFKHREPRVECTVC